MTYGCMINACVKNDRLDLALVLIDKMKADKLKLNTIVYTTLIKGFSRARKLDKALEIFATMKENRCSRPNQITYNGLFNECVKCGKLDKASEIFDEMKSGHIRPDLITFSTLIKGFCRAGNMRKA